MQTIYDDPAYTYVMPTNQGPYNITIDGHACAMVRSQVEAIHNRLNENSLVHEGVCIGTNNLIIYTAGGDVVAPLRRRYIDFGDTTHQQMIKHIRTNVCIKMNTKEKDAFKIQ